MRDESGSSRCSPRAAELDRSAAGGRPGHAPGSGIRFILPPQAATPSTQEKGGDGRGVGPLGDGRPPRWRRTAIPSASGGSRGAILVPGNYPSRAPAPRTLARSGSAALIQVRVGAAVAATAAKLLSATLLDIIDSDPHVPSRRSRRIVNIRDRGRRPALAPRPMKFGPPERRLRTRAAAVGGAAN